MESNNQNLEQCPKFARIFLGCLGIFTIYRGILHIFFTSYTADIAKVNATADINFLLVTIGVCQFTLGINHLIITFKAKNLVPIWIAILCAINFSNLLLTVIYSPPTAEFPGRFNSVRIILIGVVVLVLIPTTKYLKKHKKI